VNFGGHTETVRRRGRPRAQPLGAGLGRHRPALQLHGPRLPQRRRQHAAAVAGARDATPSTCTSSTPATTPRRCGRRPSPRTSPRCSTPRTPRRRARSCACSSSTSSWPARSRTSSGHTMPKDFDVRDAARADHLPAQRHPPGHRHPRADAHPRRRARPRVGRGVGHHQAVLRLHLPHPAARGARGLAGVSLMERLAAAPHGDHLPDQRGASSPSCARPVPGDDELRVRRMSIISTTDDPSARCAWPTWPRSPLGQGQRRRRAALRSCSRTRSSNDFSELWPDRFTNVTNGVTPRRFIRQSNPALTELITDTIGKGWVADLDRLEPSSRAYSRRRGLPREAFRAVKAHEQGTDHRPSSPERDGIQPPCRATCSTSWSSACTSTSASRSRLLHIVTLYDRLTSGEVDPASHHPAHGGLRRQGGPGLPDGQGDDLPHQLGGQDRQRRSLACRVASSSPSRRTTT
jgi:hypothetical protein